ncbi:MAG: hypothetical protein EB037_13875 [Actinobacteria bacterium]|nr:hypothetical protein [Actinomycetota bacterium]
MMALVVAGPNTPSAPPRTVIPAAMRARCNVTTAGPLWPTVANAVVGAVVAGVVVAGAVVAGAVVAGAVVAGVVVAGDAEAGAVVVGVVVGVALAGATPSAMAVVMSRAPVAVIPRDDWNALIAAAVPDPKTPSTPPRTLIPAATRAFCRAVTATPRSPRLGNTGDGPRPNRKAVDGSMSPLAIKPLAD